MNKILVTISTVLGLLLLMSFIFRYQTKPITIYLVGDSTMANKQTSAYPETGWGMPFAYFFNETVKVANHAQNGRSTRSFIEEKRWQPIVDKLQPGDYVFVQFGHNDEVKTKKSATTEEEFKANLTRYITDTRNKKAIPIMLTPVARRSFDDAGKVIGTHEVYSELVRQVAKKELVQLIDLDKRSQEVLQKYGVENSKFLFNHLAPGEHPNYPEGKQDNTHFNELGARIMAQLVLAEIKTLKIELTDRVVRTRN